MTDSFSRTGVALTWILAGLVSWVSAAPTLQCPNPAIVRLDAVLQADQASLAAVLSCSIIFTFPNGSTVGSAEGRNCVIRSTSLPAINVDKISNGQLDFPVASFTTGGTFDLDAQLGNSTILVRAPNTDFSCTFTVMVTAGPTQNVEVQNFMFVRSLASTDLSDVAVLKYFEYCKMTKDAVDGELISLSDDADALDDVANAALRLAEYLPINTTLSARMDILSALKKLSDRRFTARLAAPQTNPRLRPASCGDETCEVVTETCSNCPEDCSLSYALKQDLGNNCASAATIRVTNGQIEYETNYGQRRSGTPLITQTSWDPLPAGFGNVEISLAVSTALTSTEADYGVEFIGIHKSDTQSVVVDGAVTQKNYKDPEANLPSKHSFAGVTFAAGFTTRQTGAPTPNMELVLDLSTWGRKLTVNTNLSLWYLDATSTWQQCAGRLALDPALLTYSASMTGCFKDIGNQARQYALFVTTSNTFYRSVEDAVMTAVGELLVYTPPDSYLVRDVTGQDAVAELQFKETVAMEMFPKLISLSALDDTSTNVSGGALSAKSKYIGVVADRVEFGMLGGNRLSVSTLNGNMSAVLALPSNAAWAEYDGLADDDVVVFGAVLHPNIYKNPLPSTHVYSDQSLSMYFKDDIEDTPRDQLDTALIRGTISITFTQHSDVAYETYDVEETSRRCAEAEAPPVQQDQGNNGVWSELTTASGFPTSADTVCEITTGSSWLLSWYFPVVTTTTTTTMSTSTATSVTTATTETTTTATLTSTTSTKTIEAEILEDWRNDQPSIGKVSEWEDNLAFLVILILYLLMFLCVLLGFREWSLYSEKLRTYEANVGKDALSNMPMPTEPDLLARPLPTWATRLCPSRCLAYCFRGWERSAVLGMLCSCKSLCSPISFPTRPMLLCYFATIISLPLAICAIFGYIEDQQLQEVDVLPRDWVYDMGLPIESYIEQRVIVNDTAFVRVKPARIRFGAVSGHEPLLLVDGVVDGVWAAAFTLPVMLLLSLFIGKFRSYTDVVRILAPARFRATFRGARAAMEARNLPIDFWIRRANNTARGIVIDNGLITVQPVDEMNRKNNSGGGDDDDDYNPAYKRMGSSTEENKFFDQGYLEMDPNSQDNLTKKVAETKLPADPRGLGWGTDSIMGDEAMSGAGNAIPQDKDSLMGYLTEHDYEKDFTKDMETLVKKARCWRNAVVSVTFLAIIFSIGATWLFLKNSALNRNSQSRFVCGAGTSMVIIWIILTPLFWMFIAMFRSCGKSPVPGDKAVRVPTFANTTTHMSVY
eukprot:m.208614 g.208614  ORF g.208614 m.208614 type:complete len:1279 (+) comp33015_c0_seq1:308-4144(+)